jgi:hypothetical protein
VWAILLATETGAFTIEVRDPASLDNKVERCIMKRIVLGTLLGVGVVMAAVAAAEQRGDGPVQRATPAAPAPVTGSELIVVPASLGDKVQMLTVVDPRQQVLSVYHIELATGKITLKSVRNIQADLQIDCLNNDEHLLPQEIRSSLKQR